MKTDINLVNLIQNTIRCIIAYPVVFALIIVSIPLNAFVWIGWLIELTISFFEFVFKGNSGIEFTFFYDVFVRFEETFLFKILCVFPLTLFGIDIMKKFNTTLKPILKKK